MSDALNLSLPVKCRDGDSWCWFPGVIIENSQLCRILMFPRALASVFIQEQIIANKTLMFILYICIIHLGLLVLKPIWIGGSLFILN